MNKHSLTVAGKNLYKLATVSGVFGINGFIKVKSSFLDIDVLYKVLTLLLDDNLPLYFYDDNSFPKKRYLKDLVYDSKGYVKLLLNNINSVSDANLLKNNSVYVDRVLYNNYLAELDSPYLLLGYSVIQNGKELGKITDIVNNSGQKLLILDKNDIMIPAVDEFIKHIDYQAEFIEVKLPENFI